MKKPNLEKIRLYCILHNITQWQDVPSCHRGCGRGCPGRKRWPIGVTHFWCKRGERNEVLPNTFTFTEGPHLLIFEACDKVKI